ncbi:MAG: DUF6776 family protein [Steroidobacteraceae bacterium]
MESPARVVIRTYAPARRWLALGGATALVLLALYVTYEFGRFDAGFDRLAVAQQRTELGVEIERLQADNRELRVQLAAQETGRVGQTRERSEIARTIGALQAQVARQAQDLAFYRGIVGQGAQGPPIRIQQFRVLGSEDTPAQVTVHLELGRPVSPEDQISGTISITVEGSRGEQTESHELAKLTGDQTRELRFNFRYRQTIDQPLTLPAGFKPERTTVELRPSKKGVDAIRQTYLWKLESA